MKIISNSLLNVCVGLFILLNVQGSNAQVSDRNIEEIKSESLLRAQRGAYPLGGLDG